MSGFQFATVLALGLTVGMARSARGEDIQSVWQEGNDAYKVGQYDVAIERYNAVALSCPGGWVFYNLGNAYFKAGRLGQAVLAYKRAERRFPRSREVRENLSLAMKAASVEEKASGSVTSAFRNALSKVAVTEWLLAFSFLYILGACIGFADLVRRSSGLKQASMAFLGAALCVLALLGLRQALSVGRFEAVVIQKEVYGYVGPDEGDEKTFKAGEGSIVLLLGRERGDWVEASPSDGSCRGWVLKGGIEPVDP